jgi:hypothetical protein
MKSTPETNNITMISAADIFVQCVTRQINLVKNEYVLLRYIQNCVQFKGLYAILSTSNTATLTIALQTGIRLGDETRVKLQSTLYDYTSPGGPAYAPRSVRNASKTTLDILFPVCNLIVYCLACSCIITAWKVVTQNNTPHFPPISPILFNTVSSTLGVSLFAFLHSHFLFSSLPSLRTVLAS